MTPNTAIPAAPAAPAQEPAQTLRRRMSAAIERWLVRHGWLATEAQSALYGYIDDVTDGLIQYDPYVLHLLASAVRDEAAA